MLNTIGEEIRDWGEIRQVAPHYEAIKRAVLSVSSDMVDKQVTKVSPTTVCCGRTKSVRKKYLKH